MNSTPPATPSTIDFYASTAADPSGYGEGERWLGWITVTTDTGRNPGLTTSTLDFTTAPGEVLTATATGPEGASEFSLSLAVQCTPDGRRGRAI